MTTQFRCSTPVEFINSLADWAESVVGDLREDTAPSEKAPEQEPDAPAEEAYIDVNPYAEAARILKKLEENAHETNDGLRLQIVDRYLQLVDLING